MNKRSLVYSFVTGLMFASFSVIAANEDENAKTSALPDNVKSIVEKSCFGCHNTDSKNDKAKEKLTFNTLDSLELMKQIVAYKDIHEVLEKNEMPPEKFLERFPDKKVSDADKKILMDWAKKEMEALKSK